MAGEVLDSFALLTFLRQEPGHQKVVLLLEKAEESGIFLHMSEVNYAEVKSQTLRKDGARQWKIVAENLPLLPLQFHDVTRSLADQAGEFKARHKLSLADAFAAALALRQKSPLVTGDSEFKALEKEIKILWL